MGVKIFALIVLIILLAFAIVVIVALGSMPGKIAEKRNHPNKTAIKAGGWATLFLAQPGWPFVLMWAYSTTGRLRVEDDETAELHAQIAELQRKLKETGAEQ